MLFPHGLIFHHFHNGEHPPGQGSITASFFREILEYVGIETLVSAEDWMGRALTGSLSDTDICITFDDNLRCQYDIALPVLRDLGLTAFWFVYTSPLEGIVEKLELYRYFRSIQFHTPEDFYAAFYQAAEESGMAERIDKTLRRVSLSSYLSDKPFYSLADRKFRYVRNEVLATEEYDNVMDQMINATAFDRTAMSSRLWMDDLCLQNLREDGHVIGLHSHRHHTGLAEAGRSRQQKEYSDNYRMLMSILEQPPLTASYPFGEYNDDTLSIMKSLGITLGFRADMAGPAASVLEFPRENHATIMMRMPS